VLVTAAQKVDLWVPIATWIAVLVLGFTVWRGWRAGRQEDERDGDR